MVNLNSNFGLKILLQNTKDYLVKFIFSYPDKSKEYSMYAIRSHNISDGKCVWAQTHT